MNVSEMMSNLRDRMLDTTDPEDAVDPVLLLWLNQAYLRIQRQSLYWSFLHNRGLVFSSVADPPTHTYSLPLIRTIDQRTVYATSDGGSDNFPLFRGDYGFWVEEQRYGMVASGQPVQLIEAPKDSWILYPTPDAIYDVYGDYWSQPDTLASVNDEPIWADDLHDLVWLTALRIGIPRILEDRFAKSAVEEAASLVPSIMTEMQRRYLSGFSR
jgi:hypothetical protein